MITVQHQALELNWLTADKLDNPKTLVLGSFNPFNPNGNSITDYYYGRETNQFWKSIARNIGQPENYFFDNRYNISRKTQIMKSKFCCYDVIDNIKFECKNQHILNDFLNDEIFSKFSDNVLWTKNKKEKGETITLTRNYNKSILNLLEETESIKRVIHTMGKRIIDKNCIKPVEAKIEPIGFKQYIHKIITICERKGIIFDFDSFSPSQFAINKGSTKKSELDKWLCYSLNLK